MTGPIVVPVLAIALRRAGRARVAVMVRCILLVALLVVIVAVARTVVIVMVVPVMAVRIVGVVTGRSGQEAELARALSPAAVRAHGRRTRARHQEGPASQDQSHRQQDFRHRVLLPSLRVMLRNTPLVALTYEALR